MVFHSWFYWIILIYNYLINTLQPISAMCFNIILFCLVCGYLQYSYNSHHRWYDRMPESTFDIKRLLHIYAFDLHLVCDSSIFQFPYSRNMIYISSQIKVICNIHRIFLTWPKFLLSWNIYQWTEIYYGILYNPWWNRHLYLWPILIWNKYTRRPSISRLMCCALNKSIDDPCYYVLRNFDEIDLDHYTHPYSHHWLSQKLDNECLGHAHNDIRCLAFFSGSCNSKIRRLTWYIICMDL